MPNLRLRPEQQEAVNQTFLYYQHPTHNNKFLWNAKPRFGKTVATYEFVKKISATRVLIITNRPVIASSWISDYFDFYSASLPHAFATRKGGIYHKQHIYSRQEILSERALLSKPLIYFVSMQDAKGTVQNDEDFKAANQWIFDINKKWDLVIIDESHEATKTSKSHKLFEKLHADFWLYLSGTPFRALADCDFESNQIFNWAYLDERKQNTDSPELHFKLCSLSNFLPDTDLTINELFQTDQHGFMHPSAVSQWLNHLIPYLISSDANRGKLNHSFWLLSGVSECCAMHQVLSSHPDLHNFRINLVIGKPADHQKLLRQIQESISSNPTKTQSITLSCGQLTTGVTIPEWSQVFMLYDNKDIQRISVTQYIQAAFRAQNPWHDDIHKKSQCDIYDFNPSRALSAHKEYAEKLCQAANHKNALHELIQYAPVELFSNGSFNQITAADFIFQLQQNIAKEIVDNKFIYSDQLFAQATLDNPPTSTYAILNQIHGVHKNRIETSPVKLLPTPNAAPSENPERTARQKPNELLDTQNSQQSTRSHHLDSQTLANHYRDKLRGLTRCMPILLHLYGKQNQTFNDFITSIPQQQFKQITHIDRESFNFLDQQHCFEHENLSLAMQEFMHREDILAEFITTSGNIFDYISSECAGEFFSSQKISDIFTSKLATQKPSLFQNPKTTFCDIYAKSGTTLLSLAQQLFLAQYNEKQTKHDCLLHIFSKQIYAFAPSELFQKIIFQTITRCLEKYHFTAEELRLIHKNIKILNPLKVSKGEIMKFDIIISNPPYQKGRHQSYADFYRLAVDLNPELLCMIFPTGWQKPQNHNGLGQLNNAHYKRDPHIVSIDHYYEDAREKLFPEINTGSLNIILRDRKYDNHGKIQKLEFGQPAGEMVLPISVSEIPKPSELTCLIPLLELYPKMSALGSSRKPYGFYADPLRNPQKYNLKLQGEKEKSDDVRLFGLFSDSTRGSKYIARRSLPKVSPNLDTYKLFVPKAWGNMSERIGLGGSYANICVASPGDACSETFIEFGSFSSQSETIKMAKYFMTKFFRALLFLAKTSQNSAKDKYCFIPVPDLSTKIWTKPISELDDALFRLYKIPMSSQKFIKTHVQERDEKNIEIL